MRADLDEDRRVRDVRRRGVDERGRRGGDRRAIGGIVDDDQHARASRGRSRDRERIDGGAVERHGRVERSRQRRELGRQVGAVLAIDRALVLERPIDGGGAGRDRERDDDPGTSAHAANVACCSCVNAVAYMVARMPAATIRRLGALRVNRFERGADRLTAPGVLDIEQATTRLLARWRGDLCGLLNVMTRGELAELAATLRIVATGRSPELRMALWDRGAELERGDVAVSAGLQPRPIVLGGHLVVQAAPRGMFPASSQWPRPLPPRVATAPAGGEPETLDDLLAAADRLIGVRLGPRGRDKGAWGMRAAHLLGIVEHGHGEPDWRGDVEVKTVPVAQEASGHWRIVEDPAIAMIGEGGLSKLQRTLWLARASLDAPEGNPDATILSWYLLDWDAEVARLAKRYLHERPKGPAGTTARGLYLHKRFFADAGMLATLNGWAACT